MTAPTIHLQGIGSVPAIPASDLEVGTVTLWNYGYEELVVSVEPASPQFVTVVLRNGRGVEFTRRMRRHRLVGVATMCSMCGSGLHDYCAETDDGVWNADCIFEPSTDDDGRPRRKARR